MREEGNKKSKVSWSKSLVRKWFNIKNKAQDFHADYDATPQTQGRDGGERRTSCSSERDAAGGAAKKSRTGVYEEWKDCQKQVKNFSGNNYQGYESREVAEEKWRRHGRKKWRNFLVITTLLLFMVGYVFYFI